jgi:hypothetical protein
MFGEGTNFEPARDIKCLQASVTFSFLCTNADMKVQSINFQVCERNESEKLL